jgi:hypothetical protein
MATKLVTHPPIKLFGTRAVSRCPDYQVQMCDPSEGRGLNAFGVPNIPFDDWNY